MQKRRAVAVLVLAWTLLPVLAAASPQRPLIAVVGENEGTETTDFIVPYGVLKASGVADVVDVGVHAGPIQMMPALKIAPSESIQSFDAKNPHGADYVIVPAMHHNDEPTLLAWLQAQAKSGATIVGVCDGGWVVANAGLLENRSATGHWYSFGDLEKKFPKTRWVKNQRYVRDGNVITTTGVTASLPMSLSLVEQIGGRERAEAVAAELGVSKWDDSHQSDLYHLSSRDIATAAGNWLAIWRWEKVGIPIAPGVDEIGLSFTADAFGRTYRSSSVTVGAGEIVSKRGLRILPDQAGDAGLDRTVTVPDLPPAQVLDQALATITDQQGAATADFVALQLEYPRP